MIAALWIASELIHHSLVTVTGTDPLRRACPHAADAHALMFFWQNANRRGICNSETPDNEGTE